MLEAQDLHVGDKILVIGETTGVYEDIIKELRVDMNSVESVGKGTLFSIKTNEIIRRNDKLFKLQPRNTNKNLNYYFCKEAIKRSTASQDDDKTPLITTTQSVFAILHNFISGKR